MSQQTKAIRFDLMFMLMGDGAVQECR